MTVDQLHGTLIAYEMRIEEDTYRKKHSKSPPNKQGRTNQQRASQQVMIQMMKK